eukprot:179669_1
MVLFSFRFVMQLLVTVQLISIGMAMGVSNCLDAFKHFATTKRMACGEIKDGIEYYHRSLISTYQEWFIDKNGTSAKDTLFEPCQTFINYAIILYHLPRHELLQLKIRHKHDTYYLYIKARYHTNQPNNWFDIIQYHSHRHSLYFFKGKPILKHWMRSQLNHKNVTFVEDVMIKNHRLQMQKTALITRYFDDFPSLQKLEKKHIVSIQNQDNHYYPKTRRHNVPSDSLYIAINDLVPINAMRIKNGNHRDVSVVMYHVVTTTAFLEQSLLGYGKVALDDAMKYTLSGSSSYELLKSCAWTHFDLIRGLSGKHYFVILKLSGSKQYCTRQGFTRANIDKVDQFALDDLYDITCPLGCVRINGIIIKQVSDCLHKE